MEETINGYTIVIIRKFSYTLTLFIQWVQRFIGRHENLRMRRFDNGSNFIGAESKLNKGFMEIDNNQTRTCLQNLGSDWMIWKKHPPAGSHFGGIWKDEISFGRAGSRSLRRTHGSNLNDETLNTLLIEVEAVLNSRRLTGEAIADGTKAAILPSSLLTMKSKIVMPSPESFGKLDLYSRKR